MKFNTLRFVSSSFNSLIIAIFIVILAAMTTAKAQGNSDVINGLFTPTSAQRFFQAGRDEFEKEVKVFTHPEQYPTNHLLRIDPALIKQMEETKLLPGFVQSTSRNRLYLDFLNLI